MRHLPSLVLLAACAGSTTDTDVSDVSCPELVQDVDSLTFGSALFDSPTTRAVYLSFPCPGVLGLDDPVIDGDDAFTARVDSIDMSADGTALLEVTYAPQPGDYGPHAAAVRMTHDAGELFVSLVGEVDPDQDGDGVDAEAVGGEDCDDSDPLVGVPTDEADNLRDDDCDGLVDEDFVQVGDVLITELMLRPSAVRPEVGQWVELLNRSERPVDLKGWTLSGTDGDLTVAESVVVNAGRRAVLALEVDPASNGGIEADAGLDGAAALAARDWSLDLFVGELQVAALEDDADWPDPRGASISLDPTLDMERDARKPDGWCASTTLLESGDAGTPGTENDWCPQIDHDGDGESVLQGDCDDADPARGRRVVERWDGIDNDCDTFVDDLFADTGSGTLVTGETNSQLGGITDLQVRDWNGDGYDDIILALRAFNSELGFIDGASLWGQTDVAITSLVDGTFTGDRAQAQVPGTAGDLDGDGDVDLGVLLDLSDGSHVIRVYDAPPMAGQRWGADDADIVVVETDAPLFTRTSHAILDLDLNGDGIPEAITADTRDNDGIVMVMDLDGRSGSLALEDVQERAWTGAEDSGLGAWLSGGDVDGDGYDDLFVTDSDPLSRVGGITVSRVSGSASLPEGGPLDDIADLDVTGPTASFGLLAGRTAVGDVDGDGSLDLLVGDPSGGELHLLADVAGDSGSHTLSSSSDLVITGAKALAGTSFDQVDYDADGAMDLIVGAATTNSTDRGVVFGLSAATLASGASALDPTDADFTVLGVDGRDRFGMLLQGGDFDGDGLRNGLLVTAPYASPSSTSFYDGALYLFEPE